jgi:hypothetical protein
MFLNDKADSMPSCRTVAARWLFPEVADVRGQVEPMHRQWIWADAHLNAEQMVSVLSGMVLDCTDTPKYAARHIATEMNPRVPYLISGPPGVSRLAPYLRTLTIILFPSTDR